MVHGRRGDVIVTGGEKVWPDAVERALSTHPNIVECAVAAANDAEWGQRVVAWIVPRLTTPPALEEIRDHVATTLPRYCSPRQLVVVDSLPRTSLGKVVRRALIDQLPSHE
jgi:acyl-coenzyme A synthetase/AMP-(fatty) acid ligase